MEYIYELEVVLDFPTESYDLSSSEIAFPAPVEDFNFRHEAEMEVMLNDFNRSLLMIHIYTLYYILHYTISIYMYQLCTGLTISVGRYIILNYIVKNVVSSKPKRIGTLYGYI